MLLLLLLLACIATRKTNKELKLTSVVLKLSFQEDTLRLNEKLAAVAIADICYFHLVNTLLQAGLYSNCFMNTNSLTPHNDSNGYKTKEQLIFHKLTRVNVWTGTQDGIWEG